MACRKEEKDMVDMWGDEIVGRADIPEWSLADPEPVTPEYALVENDIYVHRGGYLYRLKNGVYEKIYLDKSGRSQVQERRVKKIYDVALEVAKAFLPNPLGLPHIRKRSPNQTDVDSIRWSTHNRKQLYTIKARRAEVNKRGSMDVLQPFVEVPVTVTIKSLA